MCESKDVMIVNPMCNQHLPLRIAMSTKMEEASSEANSAFISGTMAMFRTARQTASRVLSVSARAPICNKALHTSLRANSRLPSLIQLMLQMARATASRPASVSQPTAISRRQWRMPGVLISFLPSVMQLILQLCITWQGLHKFHKNNSDGYIVFAITCL